MLCVNGESCETFYISIEFPTILFTFKKQNRKDIPEPKPGREAGQLVEKLLPSNLTECSPDS